MSARTAHTATRSLPIPALPAVLALLAGCTAAPSDGTFFCNPLVSQTPSDQTSSKAEIWRTKYGEQIYWQATVEQGEVVDLRLYFDDIGPTEPYPTGAAQWRDDATFVVDVGLPPDWGSAAGLASQNEVAVLCLLDT